MSDSQIIWLGMAAFALITGVLLLFLEVDKSSIHKASQISPMAGLFRFKYMKYVVALLLFFISFLSFALYKGWVK